MPLLDDSLSHWVSLAEIVTAVVLVAVLYPQSPAFHRQTGQVENAPVPLPAASYAYAASAVIRPGQITKFRYGDKSRQTTNEALPTVLRKFKNLSLSDVEEEDETEAVDPEGDTHIPGSPVSTASSENEDASSVSGRSHSPVPPIASASHRAGTPVPEKPGHKSASDVTSGAEMHANNSSKDNNQMPPFATLSALLPHNPSGFSTPMNFPRATSAPPRTLKPEASHHNDESSEASASTARGKGKGKAKASAPAATRATSAAPTFAPTRPITRSLSAAPKSSISAESASTSSNAMDVDDDPYSYRRHENTRACWFESNLPTKISQPPDFSTRTDVQPGDVFINRTQDSYQLWIWEDSGNRQCYWMRIFIGHKRAGKELTVTPKLKQPSWVSTTWSNKTAKQRAPA
ncbi:hypothetical protein BDW22DRAFT_1430690 [Trametopsis cervina]|nr:hypothetical protein BDW22DRAFT_1430690 [Trametopsis cervina]